jgi:hypothetical protein
LIPLARTLQQYVYETVGKDFFLYLSFFFFTASLLTLLYFLFFKLRIKKSPQYIWLMFCGGLYIVSTYNLRKHPEEPLHLVEYGFLSFFVFNALRYRIKDWTIYLTTALIVLFFGSVDEFIQWLIPGRYWELKDVWINVLASLIFVLAVWKGIRPHVVSQPVGRLSVRILMGAFSINLLFLGLCLSNTPAAVKSYTGMIDLLSWLQYEEPMIEYGYRHEDPEIGVFYSRFRLEKLKEIDRSKGPVNGKRIPPDISLSETRATLLRTFNQTTNPFLYEFLVHLFRRNTYVTDFNNSESSKRLAYAASKENSIIEKYFGIILKNTPFMWSESEKASFNNKSLSWSETYRSDNDRMITAFDVTFSRIMIVILMVVVWSGGALWIKKLRIC